MHVHKVSYQLKLMKMRAKLAHLNNSAVPFLSCAGANLCWHYSTFKSNRRMKFWSKDIEEDYRSNGYPSKTIHIVILLTSGVATSKGEGDGSGPFRATAKLHLFLKIWEGGKYFEAGKKVFLGGGERLLRFWEKS